MMKKIKKMKGNEESEEDAAYAIRELEKSRLSIGKEAACPVHS